MSIDEIYEIAKLRNGSCLSSEFLGWKYKLKWQCESGHIWESTLSNVKYGKWCPECAKVARGLKRRDTIENMIKIAASREGKCLSTMYEGDNIHLYWQCKCGHKWEATPSNIKRGKWCPKCAIIKSSNKRRSNIGEMNLIASKKDGKCLSTVYTNMNTKLEWECNDGHKWWATPSNIKRGKWCPKCAGKYKTIEEMHRHALKLKGRCLSTEFSSMMKKLKWECEFGHKWESTPNSIINKQTWCPKCGGTTRKTIAYCEGLAKERGGSFLSEEYLGVDVKHSWQCVNRHTFELTPFDISKGRWCSICNDKVLAVNEAKCRFIFEELTGKPFYKTRKVLNNGYEIDGYNDELKIGFEYNGLQHYEYKEFFHSSEEVFAQQQIRDQKKYDNAMELGIYLITIPYTVESDSEKVTFIIEELKKLKVSLISNVIGWDRFYKGFQPLEELITIAKEKEGDSLSLAYEGVNTKLTWRCNAGHIFEASPYQIKRGSWCPRCSGRKILIEDMQELAKEKGGKCLSEKYINNSTKLLWCCEKGHTWEAMPLSISRGTWCPTCNGTKRYTLEDMKSIAKSKSGDCLTDSFKSLNRKLKWQCSNGHIWPATGASVLNGTWCKECSRPTIDEAQQLAAKYNGQCISEKYIDSITKLEWKCSLGHSWFSILGNIKRGRWCPECKVIEKERTKEKKLLELKSMAHKRGGECLSNAFVDVDTKLRWKCKFGHEWETTPYAVNNGAWCHKCAAKTTAEKLKDTIEHMREIASSRGGECLSDFYFNNATHLKWRCGEGHEWESTPGNIKNGTWCPTCSNKLSGISQRKTIEDMIELAKNKGGKCLSTEYKNAHTHLIWQCKCGYQWSAKPNNIQQGKWCPQCGKKKNKS